jgi:hypothetical protein
MPQAIQMIVDVVFIGAPCEPHEDLLAGAYR